MQTIILKNGSIVNEGVIQRGDILIKNGLIEKIAPQINENAQIEINAEDLHIFPGAIDDQVHFREPGLTHKATIFTESRAAVSGGVTSFMEMPNTNPAATTQVLLEEKYAIASKTSLANYSFFMGTTNSNLEELKKTNPLNVCGIKIFMGSSTGDMLVDNVKTLETIFSEIDILIATHCEDDILIKNNLAALKLQKGDDISILEHHLIRSEQACYNSSSFAVELAKKFNTKLHILHISTAKELALFSNKIPLSEKRITAEACIHHLWFSNEDYVTKGNYIKWNPAVKTPKDREAIFNAVLDGTIDVIATDHAPHTSEEKEQPYLQAPSGGPLVQHSMNAMIDFYHQGKITLPKIAEKMSHNVATLFNIDKRGFIREGYFADLALINIHKNQLVTKESLNYKCAWSPFEGHTFNSTVEHTIVSGQLVYSNGKFNESKMGKRLNFNR